MKALHVDYNKDTDEFNIVEGRKEKDWVAVCDRYDNDVQRIRNVENHSPYTGLFACFNEDNQALYFLVEENRQLNKIRHKSFLRKLGRSDWILHDSGHNPGK